MRQIIQEGPNSKDELNMTQPCPKCFDYLFWGHPWYGVVAQYIFLMYTLIHNIDNDDISYILAMVWRGRPVNVDARNILFNGTPLAKLKKSIPLVLLP